MVLPGDNTVDEKAPPEARIPLFDLITCISETVDLANPALTNHHMQVAYTAHALATELGLPEPARNAVFLAGALHDLGSFSLAERLEILDFEIDGPHTHARIGYHLLREFEPFTAIAGLVRHHHVRYDKGGEADFPGEKVSQLSHLLHLADRAAVLIRRDEPILWQSAEVQRRLTEQRGAMFPSHLVDAFCSLASHDYFWFDMVSHSPAEIMRRRVKPGVLPLDMKGLQSLANLFRRIIDFRSRFTATHSSGVAIVAETLGRFHGFSQHDCGLLRIAGHLHDLGKVGIPNEILEKPDRLDNHEYGMMRGHVYHTYRVLEVLGDLDTVRMWGALHQEHLDGQGYPFGMKDSELSMGSRIVAVADVFTAVTEDRPYRKGMSPGDAMGVLQRMADAGKLDAGLVGLLRDHFAELNEAREQEQQTAAHEYQAFFASIV